MSITWREAMSVGEAVIDDDHRHLVDLINNFEIAVSGVINHKRIARVLLGLVEYTGEHFAREEDLQLKIRYPFHESHRRSHRDVLKKLSEFVEVYTATPDGPKRDRMVVDLGVFLKEWLVDHIIQSDLRMKPYVQAWRDQQLGADKRRSSMMAG
jgi:hemerythrin